MKKTTWVVVGMWVMMSSWLVGPVGQAARGQELEVVSPQERHELVDQVVRPFLQALQTGNTQRLEQLIGGKLARTLGKLLRQNPAYPDFLRQRYGGTRVQESIEIRQHRQGGGLPAEGATGPRLATVQLLTPAGGKDQFLLTLEQDAQGVWKIIDKKMLRE